MVCIFHCHPKHGSQVRVRHGRRGLLSESRTHERRSDAVDEAPAGSLRVEDRQAQDAQIVVVKCVDDGDLTALECPDAAGDPGDAGAAEVGKGHSPDVGRGNGAVRLLRDPCPQVGLRVTERGILRELTVPDRHQVVA